MVATAEDIFFYLKTEEEDSNMKKMSFNRRLLTH